MSNAWQRVIQADDAESFAKAYLAYLNSCSKKTGYASPSRLAIVKGMTQVVNSLKDNLETRMVEKKEGEV